MTQGGAVGGSICTGTRVTQAAYRILKDLIEGTTGNSPIAT
jgi:hypothetical protein